MTGQGTPVKFSNGLVQYTSDHRLNIILNQLASNGGDDFNQHRNEVTGFAPNAQVKGIFSLPHNGGGSSLDQVNMLSEDELEIILQYEEESSRLGNFERIYPLNSNASHYIRFYEHLRPGNDLLMRYLRMNHRLMKELHANAKLDSSSPGLKKKQTR